MERNFGRVNYQESEKTIYLDNNGTTPLAPEVEAEIARSLREDWANPGTKNRIGQHARERIESARADVARLVNGTPDQIVFNSGGTETNNTVIMGICQKRKLEGGPPHHVVTTNVEHDSIIAPLKFLKATQGLEVTEVDVSDYDSIVSKVTQAIKENTVLVTIMAANNETGVIMPLEQIGEWLKMANYKRVKNKRKPIIFHSDGAQIIGKERVNARDLNLDCFTIVGHKFYGPRIGALWTRVPIPPLLFGGGSNARPGTENTPMIVGLGVAAALVNSRLNVYRSDMMEVRDALEIRLQSLPVAAKINCRRAPRLANTISVSFRIPDNFTGRDILAKCRYIVAGVGAACHADKRGPSTILINSGVPSAEASSSIRLSLGRNTSLPMVEEIANDLSQAISSILWDSLSSAIGANVF